MKDIVSITCYGKEDKMKRNEALKFYKDCAENSEGSERDRYLNILSSLRDGKEVIFDEKREQYAYDIADIVKEAGIDKRFFDRIMYENNYNDLKDALIDVIKKGRPEVVHIYSFIYEKLHNDDMELLLKSALMEYDHGKLAMELKPELLKVPEHRFYNKEFDIDNTASELFSDMKNGYYDDNIPALKYISSVFEQENLPLYKRACDMNIEYFTEKDKSVRVDDDMRLCFLKAKSYIATYIAKALQNKGSDVKYYISDIRESDNGRYESGENDYADFEYSFDATISSDEKDNKVSFTYSEDRMTDGDYIRRTAFDVFTLDEFFNMDVKEFMAHLNAMLYYSQCEENLLDGFDEVEDEKDEEETER